LASCASGSTCKNLLFWVIAVMTLIMGASRASAQAPPTAPSNFSVHLRWEANPPHADAPQAVLLWNDNSSDEDGFQIWYDFVNPDFGPDTANMPEDSTSAIFPIITNTNQPFPIGTKINFKVRSYKQIDATTRIYSTTYSNTASFTITASTLLKPTNVQGQVLSESVIRVTWANASTADDGVELEMSEGGSPFAKLGDVYFYQTPQIDVTQLASSLPYKFRLRSYKDGSPRAYSPYSAESATFFTSAPVAPTTLAAASATDTTVTLTWADTSSVESSFEIQSRPQPAPGQPGQAFLATAIIPSNTTGGTVERLQPGTVYEFRMRTRADYGSPASVSSFTNVVTKRTFDAITSPRYVQVYVNEPFNYQLTTSSGVPRTSWDVTDLPAGLTFNSGDGKITGSLATTGVFEAQMEADFEGGWESKPTLAIRVLQPPIILDTIADEHLVTGEIPDSPIYLTTKFSDPEVTTAVRVETTMGDMDFVFFDAATPLTKDNFLAYLNPGIDTYTQNLFHRSAAGFVIQGGAFKTGAAPDKFIKAPILPDVDNEPGISNIRGTVAMAKVADQPNSATNQWFVNLDNNGKKPGILLDTQNEGFTAFARVAGNGMAVADAIGNMPVGDYTVPVQTGQTTVSTPFTDFPLIAGQALPTMDNTKVVKIEKISQIIAFKFEIDPITGNTNPDSVGTIINPADGTLRLIPKESGTAQITVTATNLDGRQLTQSFQVTTVSNEARLEKLQLSSGTLVPAFHLDKFDGATIFGVPFEGYTAKVPNSSTTLMVTPTAKHAAATIEVKLGDTVIEADATSGLPVAVPLNVGDNVIDVVVTAENGDTENAKHYKITVTRSAAQLGATSLIVNESAGVVNIPLIRANDATGLVTLDVQTSSITASGSDYVAPGSTFDFPVGSISTFIPITIHQPDLDEPNERFSVTISGAAMAAPETVTVLILDAVDGAPPAVTIDEPLANVVRDLPTGTPIEVRGMASDNKGLKEVRVTLNGTLIGNATMSPAGIVSPLNAQYSRLITPKGGLNTVQIQSVDHNGGESAILTRSFTVRRPLAVEANAEFGSVTVFDPSKPYRTVGQSITLTAAPKTGKIFAGWVLAGTDVANGGVAFVPQRLGIAETALDRPTLTFIFREGLMLIANFITNPYDSTVTGTYNGLVKASPDLPEREAPAEDGSVPALGTEGYFTATVLGSGAFSGKVTIDGSVLNVAGTFDHQGRARFGPGRAFTQTVARTNKPSVIVKFDIGGPPLSVAATGKITGRVTALEFQKTTTASVSNVEADRAFYTGLTLEKTVPDPYLTVTGTAPSPKGRTDGIFTVVLPCVACDSQPLRIAAVLTKDDFPQGDGVGTLKVTKAGAVTLTATLADGTAVTATSTLSQDRRVGLFAQLYNLKGFLSAPLKLDHTQADSDLKTETLKKVLWNRPFNGAVQWYPYGWAETLEVDLLGARYIATAGQSTMRAANGTPLQAADFDGNVTMTLTDGLLDGTLVKAANLSTLDIVTKAPDNDPSFTMTVNRGTGRITGIFDHTDDTKPAYNAVIFQKGPRAGAYGYFLTKRPTIIDYTGQGGGVSIIGQ
jgi:cyclophilin family peptidyl-prolyl cis-trans isomerase